MVLTAAPPTGDSRLLMVRTTVRRTGARRRSARVPLLRRLTTGLRMNLPTVLPMDRPMDRLMVLPMVLLTVLMMDPLTVPLTVPRMDRLMALPMVLLTVLLMDPLTAIRPRSTTARAGTTRRRRRLRLPLLLTMAAIRLPLRPPLRTTGPITGLRTVTFPRRRRQTLILTPAT
jgi:hypothetical protein